MKNYISQLRLIATFAVILLHTAAFYVGKFNVIPLADWEIANFIDSICRFCIPIFLMISGALFLDKDEPLKTFLLKRLKRIILPFLFWALCYFIINNYDNFSNVSLLSIFQDFGLYIYKSASLGHFWYIYLLLGLYLFIPILRKWTIHATKQEIIYFLAIWFISLFITKHTIKYFPNIEFQYFSNYIGYLVLGHFLDKYVNYSSYKARIISILMFVIAVLITYKMTSLFSIKFNELIRHFYAYLAPNVLIASIGLFLFVKSLSTSSMSNILKLTDKVSYGIYLIHILILEFVRSTINLYTTNNQISLLANILIVSMCTFFLSFLIIHLLAKITFLRTIVT